MIPNCCSYGGLQISYIYSIWKYSIEERKQSRRFLVCVDDNFLTPAVSKPTREGTLLDVLFASREGLVGDVIVGSCVGYNDHEMIEFFIFVEVRKMVSRIATLNFQGADFIPFRDLVDRVHLEVVPKGKGVQESWTFFTNEIIKALDQALLMCQKLSQLGRRSAWLNRELLQKLRERKSL